jgi:hypothetical protein
MLRCICSRNALRLSISTLAGFFVAILVPPENESIELPRHFGHVGHVED